VLSVELDLSEKETIEKAQSSGYLKNGETIDNYLTESETEKLSSIFKSLSPNLNIDSIKYLNPPSLYSLLTKLCCAKAGILGNGLDLLMINEMKQHNAARDTIVINELEGVDSQIIAGNKTFTWNYIKEYIN
ncbi:TraB/GumN family protein, partial [Clostridium perfringens]